MSQIIIYKQDNNIPAIIIPTISALGKHSIRSIAIKDVPAGKPFKIVNMEDLQYALEIPQEAWIIDDIDLTDGVGGFSNEFN
jgi:hypothetical protein